MSLTADGLKIGEVGVVVLRTRRVVHYGEKACLKALERSLAPIGLGVREHVVVKPDAEIVAENVAKMADHMRLPAIFTVGGTGLHREDVAPEGIMLVIHRLVPGIPEIIRAKLGEVQPDFILSRGQAGLRGRTLVANLPEAPADIEAGVAVITPVLQVALARLREPRQEAQVKLL